MSTPSQWQRSGSTTVVSCFRAFLTCASLLASAGAASAECAWVLWAREHTVLAVMADGHIRSGEPYSDWAVITAFPEYSDCSATAAAQYQMTIKARSRPMTAGETVLMYRCLPDTIDPRGPRSK